MEFLMEALPKVVQTMEVVLTRQLRGIFERAERLVLWRGREENSVSDVDLRGDEDSDAVRGQAFPKDMFHYTLFTHCLHMFYTL